MNKTNRECSSGCRTARTIIAGVALQWLALSAGAAELQLPWLQDERPGSGIEASRLAESVGPASPPLAAPQAKASVTLLEAIGLAVGSHPSIGGSLRSVEQQRGQLDVANAAYRPQISAGVETGKLSSYGHSQIASITLSQMLYDFGKADGRASREQSLLHKQQILVLRQIDSIARQTAEAVINLHHYQVLDKRAEEQIKAVERIYQIADSRAGSGLASRSDAVQAQTRIESSQANLYQIQSLQQQWRDRLHTLTGVQVERIEGIPQDLERRAGLERPVDYNLIPDVLAAVAEKQASQADLEAARAQRYPTLSVEASSNYAVQGVNPQNGEDQGSFNTISFKGSALLYQGGALSAQIRSASAGVEAADALINDAQLNAQEQLFKARQQVLGARTRLQVLAQRRNTMLETQSLYDDQYKIGTRSVLDLLNAAQEVYQAEADEEEARHDLWLGLVDYLAASGRSRTEYGLDNMSIQGVAIQP
jgi:adhesin transport system outer membrane protein